MVIVLVLFACAALSGWLLKCRLDMEEPPTIDVSKRIELGEIEELEHLWRVSQ